MSILTGIKTAFYVSVTLHKVVKLYIELRNLIFGIWIIWVLFCLVKIYKKNTNRYAYTICKQFNGIKYLLKYICVYIIFDTIIILNIVFHYAFNRMWDNSAEVDNFLFNFKTVMYSSEYTGDC